jgi:hypothetical protein
MQQRLPPSVLASRRKQAASTQAATVATTCFDKPTQASSKQASSLGK